MNSPAEPKVCAKCGAPLTSGALQGLCPRCLLALNLATQTEMSGEEAARAQGTQELPPSAPPTIEEIARHFPELEILELLGRGGMGAVYKARQKQLDRIVALKILPPRRGDDTAFAERFTREAKALARLNHPGIVTLYEFGKTEPPPSTPNAPLQSGLYYFLMELVDGVNLRQLLAKGRVSAREALAIVPEICDALQYAHDQGIVHRDIKPENILLDRRGRVKVADFGLAKLVGNGSEPTGAPAAAPSLVLTEAGKIMGTPQYMAPEQRANPAEVDHRADIYALGVVFYQMLTGELPGKRIEPPSKKVQLDVRLDEVVLRALEQDPERRYAQASVLKTQVETIATDMEKAGAAAASEEVLPPVGAAPVSRPWSLVAVALVFIAIGCWAGWDMANGTNLFRHTYNLNFGVFGIPIGIGLLTGRPGWRKLALISLWLAFALLALVLPLVILPLAKEPYSGKVAFLGREVVGPARVWALLAGWTLPVLLLTWAYRALGRREVKALFERARTKPAGPRFWPGWADLAGALLLLVLLARAWTLANQPRITEPQKLVSENGGSTQQTPNLPFNSEVGPTSPLQFRLVAPEGSREPVDELADPADPGGHRKVRVSRRVLLDGTAVARAGYELPQGVKFDDSTLLVADDKLQPDRQRSIELDLTLAGGRAWEEITATNLARQIAVVFRDQVLALRDIRTRLPGGHLKIQAPMSADLVREVVATLNAGPAASPQAWQFSEPVEVNLLRPPGSYSGVDLESGRCVTNSKPASLTHGNLSLVQRIQHEWMLTNGVNLAPSPVSWGVCDLVTFRVYLNPAPSGTPGRSEAPPPTMTITNYPITAADVVYNWNLMTLDEQKAVFMDPTQSSVFLFHTRKGCLGILEILKPSPGSPEVKLRYKRVKKAETHRSSSGPMPTQSATNAAASSPPAAWLPQGEVELVALSYHPSTNQPWWRPDGTVWTNGGFEHPFLHTSDTKGRRFEFVVHRRGLSKEATLKYEFEPGALELSSGSSSLLQQHPDHDLFVALLPESGYHTAFQVVDGREA